MLFVLHVPRYLGRRMLIFMNKKILIVLVFMWGNVDAGKKKYMIYGLQLQELVELFSPKYV